jgi:hypothetical protein
MGDVTNQLLLQEFVQFEQPHLARYVELSPESFRMLELQVHGCLDEAPQNLTYPGLELTVIGLFASPL